MEADTDSASDCAFNKLFTNQVPHILQKIFFSLDFKSFKQCEEVCVSWQALLTSESFGNGVNATFRREIIKEIAMSMYGYKDDSHLMSSAC